MLAELLSIVGVPLELAVSAGEWDVVCVRATLVKADDIGASEREQAGAVASHDRLLIRMAGRPWPEGLFIDRRTYVGGDWDDGDGDRTLQIDLIGGLRVSLTPQ